MQKRINAALTVSIVLPNWNGSNLLAKNLPEVMRAAPHTEIIVTDDASEDDSLSLLQKKFPAVRVVANPRQQGFAGNVNSGVAKATGDIVVLLNTDVRPKKDFLKPLLSDFSDPHVAAVGCLEESHDPVGIVLRGRGIARWAKGYFIHERGSVDKPDTAWVSGGSCAVRRDVWNRIGGMDTLYNPFYWEDIDFSYQLLKSGYRIMFERKSVVGHYHEEGKIKTSFSPSEIKRIAYRNQFLFHWKNISDPALWIAHAIWTPIRLIQSLVRGDTLMISGFIEALGKLPQVMDSRARSSALWQLNDATVLPH